MGSWLNKGSLFFGWLFAMDTLSIYSLCLAGLIYEKCKCNHAFSLTPFNDCCIRNKIQTLCQRLQGLSPVYLFNLISYPPFSHIAPQAFCSHFMFFKPLNSASLQGLRACCSALVYGFYFLCLCLTHLSLGVLALTFHKTTGLHSVGTHPVDFHHCLLLIRAMLFSQLVTIYLLVYHVLSSTNH